MTRNARHIKNSSRPVLNVRFRLSERIKHFSTYHGQTSRGDFRASLDAEELWRLFPKARRRGSESFRQPANVPQDRSHANLFFILTLFKDIQAVQNPTKQKLTDSPKRNFFEDSFGSQSHVLTCQSRHLDNIQSTHMPSKGKAVDQPIMHYSTYRLSVQQYLMSVVVIVCLVFQSVVN